MTADEAMSFVRDHGAVLVSARGPVPRLTEAIAGGPINGSWWGHPKGRQIYAILEKVGDSPEILTCRLVDGHVTLVHRRLWPALVRMADLFPRERLAQVHQEHTPSGHHVNHETAFPDWVPPEVLEEARRLDERQARSILGPLAGLPARHS